jgi:hypothetical protein
MTLDDIRRRSRDCEVKWIIDSRDNPGTFRLYPFLVLTGKNSLQQYEADMIDVDGPHPLHVQIVGIGLMCLDNFV